MVSLLGLDLESRCFGVDWSFEKIEIMIFGVKVRALWYFQVRECINPVRERERVIKKCSNLLVATYCCKLPKNFKFGTIDVGAFLVVELLK